MWERAAVFFLYLILKHFNVFCVESPVPTQPEMVVYAGCIPLNLFEEDIFLLTRMVRFCALGTGKHYLFSYQSVPFCCNYVVTKKIQLA